jgi:hypothetical protein
VSNFATVGEVEEFAGLAGTDSSTTNFISNLLTRTTKIIQEYLGRNIFQQTLTEYHSGDGKARYLIAREYPIISVTSIHDDPDRVFGSDSLLDSSEDYIIAGDGETENPGVIIRRDGAHFLLGDRNVKLVYVAGYATDDIPASIKQAQIELVTYMYQNRGRNIGVRNFRLGSYAIGYDREDGGGGSGKKSYIPKELQSLLDSYRDTRLISTDHIGGGLSGVDEF